MPTIDELYDIGRAEEQARRLRTENENIFNGGYYGGVYYPKDRYSTRERDVISSPPISYSKIKAASNPILKQAFDTINSQNLLLLLL